MKINNSHLTIFLCAFLLGIKKIFYLPSVLIRNSNTFFLAKQCITRTAILFKHRFNYLVHIHYLRYLQKQIKTHANKHFK